MNAHLFLLSALALLSSSFFGAYAQDPAQNAEPSSQITLRQVLSQVASDSRNALLSEADANLPIAKLSPNRVWSVVESANLFEAAFPSFANFTAVITLCEALESHPMKDQFIDLMLPKIATVPLFTRGTREPHDWNEIAIVGRGGQAGVLISTVTKIARQSDCQRITDAILATNDAGKIAMFREAVGLSQFKDEFETSLKQSGKSQSSSSDESSKNNNGEGARTFTATSVIVVLLIFAAIGLLLFLRK